MNLGKAGPRDDVEDAVSAVIETVAYEKGYVRTSPRTFH